MKRQHPSEIPSATGDSLCLTMQTHLPRTIAELHGTAILAQYVTSRLAAKAGKVKDSRARPVRPLLPLHNIIPDTATVSLAVLRAEQGWSLPVPPGLCRIPIFTEWIGTDSGFLCA